MAQLAGRQMIERGGGKILNIASLLSFQGGIRVPASHEQMTIIERGRVLFTIGDEQRIAQTGDVLHFPPGAWHGATMLDEEVILIDSFSPIREAV